MTTPSIQPIEKQTRSQTSPSVFKSPWKWEKRHWLLVLAIGCFALWFFSANLKEMPGLQKAIAYLPTIGGAAFALEAITKLAQ